jgi:GNAT superfamily N-acetyltransferase
MDEPTIIRLADQADCAGVTACVKAAYAPYVERIGREPGPMGAGYADLIARGMVFVLLEGGELRGVLVLKQEAVTMWIENVAVHPDHHHRGFGRRLLAYAEQRARAAKLLEVRLYTHELMDENISLYGRLGYQEVERRAEEGFRRVFMRKFLDSCARADGSTTPLAAGAVVSDLELLRIEIETLWATDDRGRIEGRDLVIGSSAIGNAVAVGSAVPYDLAALLVGLVDAAPPPPDLTLPPTVLEQCRQLLADTLGPVELTRGPPDPVTTFRKPSPLRLRWRWCARMHVRARVCGRRIPATGRPMSGRNCLTANSARGSWRSVTVRSFPSVIRP